MVLTKGSVNLVHDVERCWLVMVQRKDQGETGERLLATAQISDVFPAFFRWSHAKDNALHWRVGNPIPSGSINRNIQSRRECNLHSPVNKMEVVRLCITNVYIPHQLVAGIYAVRGQ